jgi:hypothetical protein
LICRFRDCPWDGDDISNATTKCSLDKAVADPINKDAQGSCAAAQIMYPPLLE